MKRVAYLNNHNTAAAFVVRTLQQAGAQTYIPTVCPESGAVSGDAARALRTIGTESCDRHLDALDIYGASLSVSDAQVRALDSFDLVIIPGACRTPNLIHLAERLRTRVIVLEWGDTGGRIFHDEYDAATRRSNVSVAVAYADFDRRLLHLPLGLADDLKTLPMLTASHGPPTISLIASRLNGRHSYSGRNVAEALSCLSARSHRLVILGKEHASAGFLRWFWWRWKSIERFPDLPRTEVLLRVRDSIGLLYWVREPAVLQYSALEAANLGTPVLYFADTLLSRYMPVVDPCRILRQAEFSAALAHLRGPGRASLAESQRNALSRLTESATEKWADALQ